MSNLPLSGRESGTVLLHEEEVFINGDGENSRDFCFVDHAVQANLLAAVAKYSAKTRSTVWRSAKEQL